MTRIPLVDSNDPTADPVAVEVLRSVSRHRNRTVDPNVYRAMANHPGALRALVDFGTAVYFENSLTPAQRELAYLTASVANDCHYCRPMCCSVERLDCRKRNSGILATPLDRRTSTTTRPGRSWNTRRYRPGTNR